MKKILMCLFLVSLTISDSLYAQWYNPFKSKKTPEDCILEKIKDVRGEDAIRLLTSTCWEKYGNNYESSPSEVRASKLKDQRYKKCGISSDHYKSHFFYTNFNASIKDAVRINKVIENLKNRKIELNGIEFQNNNNFGISGVLLGFTNSKTCLPKLEDYDLTFYCMSYTTKNGVNRTSFGKIQCNLPRASIGKGFCILGYSPTYDQFDDSLLEFSENNGMCID